METETELVLQETIEEVGGSDPDFEGPARKKQKKKKSPPVGNTCCCLNVHDSSFNFLYFSFRKGGVAEGKGEAVGGERASY